MNCQPVLSRLFIHELYRCFDSCVQKRGYKNADCISIFAQAGKQSSPFVSLRVPKKNTIGTDISLKAVAHNKSHLVLISSVCYVNYNDNKNYN